MNGRTGLRFALLLTVWATTWPTAVAAQTPPVLPSPLSLGDVIRLASERRDEIQAARARIRAGEARPTIVSALQDPMISPSLDHLPFMLGGADVSFTIEQQIPLSGRVGASAERVLIPIQNECGGLPGGNVNELFRPFEQRSADRTGLGLGLAFSRWGVEANHGRIYARNLPEKGCVFTLDLPRFAVPIVAMV